MVTAGRPLLSFLRIERPHQFAATGTTVEASSETDVIVAYLPNPTYKSLNVLQFEHIFSRIGSMTITEEEGYTITDVHATVVPNISGTYDIFAGYEVTDGSAGWSSLSAAAGPYELAETAPGTRSNDIYVVPGTYVLSLSWHARRGNYEQDFVNMPLEIHLAAGKVHHFTAQLGGLAHEIQMSYDVTDWDAPEALELDVPKELTTSLGFAGEDPASRPVEIPGTVVLDDIDTPVSLGSIVSYSASLAGAQAATPWRVEFSEDGGRSWSASLPSMLSDATLSGTGGFDGEVFSVTPSPRETAVTGTLATFGPEQGGPSDYVDLSKIHPLTRAEMLRETANCYIVDAPGYYKIPLIYGNSVVDGVPNPSSYIRQGAAASATNCRDMYNSWDNPIWNVNMKLDADHLGYATLGHATLLWMTEEDLVQVESEIEGPDGDGFYYLKFRVPPSKIKEGSALVGVTNSRSDVEFIWSWHIWIVGQGLLHTDTYLNRDHEAVTMLSHSLGGGSTLQVGKPARSCLIRFLAGSESRIMELVQHPVAGGNRENLNCAYYSWGRKDPSLPSDSSTGHFHEQYYTDSALKWVNTTSDRSDGQAIKIPYKRSSNWRYGVNFSKNLWDNNLGDVDTDDPAPCKTIYDPCPAKFCVPRYKFSTGFADVRELKVAGPFDHGYYFKRNDSDSEGAFWAAHGYLAGGATFSENIDNFGVAGRYWTNTAYTSYYARYMNIRDTEFIWSGESGYYGMGLAVRPQLMP